VSMMEASECVVLLKHLVTLCSFGDCVAFPFDGDASVHSTPSTLMGCGHMLFKFIDVWSNNQAC